MRIDRLHDLLRRLLADTPPDGLRRCVPTADTPLEGHPRLGGYDLVTSWSSSPDRPKLDAHIRAVLDVGHPEITEIAATTDVDNAWFRREGTVLTFTDESKVYIRMLPDPKGDPNTLIIRMFGTSAPGGAAGSEDLHGVPAKTVEWEERHGELSGVRSVCR